MHLPAIDPVTGIAVIAATAATDAVYVRFTSAVVTRRRLSAANWSGLWYLLSSFAVISYTNNWVYVGFAALGSWIGAFVSLSFLHPAPSRGPAGSSIDAAIDLTVIFGGPTIPGSLRIFMVRTHSNSEAETPAIPKIG
jgi:hypothetical protein